MLSSISGFENLPQAVKFLIAFAIISMLLVLFALVLRRLTGGRLTLASDRGRARQPRLGIVDVYDLDRQRQLILLRRDNVEHLLLVGGPNDVVVETNIMRVPGARLASVGPENGEKPDEPVERVADAAGARPTLELSPPRSADKAPDPAASAQPGRVESLPTRLTNPFRASGTPRGGEPVARAPLAAPVPGARPAERPRAVTPPIPAANEPAPMPRPGRGPQVVPGPRTASQPPREQDVGKRSPLSDLIRPAGESLRRAGDAAAPSPQQRPAEPTRQPQNLAPLPAPAEAPAPTPLPDAAPRAPEPRAEESAGPVPANRARGPVKPPPPSPAPVADAEAAPPSPPSPPPAPVSPPAVPDEPSVPPAPAAETPAHKPDPFSIEDIEAEFARLLGRPLDRKDK